ncbi:MULTISPECIES: hypothetical protein [Cellulophaga]|uniref:Membrane protein n=1 Tax=Cellulophaga baltica 18 TaxID=1348584 RepID=A0AAU8RQD3_9FLAO|nr:MULTISPECIES: hypothetical protein [Cellulophaga]AIY13108.1 membrane protein [Cellulophaga baltica NN016038]AIZ41477.1 membrane protein [Cellulophaga baltica 18]MCR1023690.1 hypothetical protein [Cellulophaga baltica]QXP51594.1 hypothetical protein H0I24_15815 [Cellulophaga sp. HaHa_2_1]QXP56079.1 hypothetical protein H0I25_18815 [Cellulophaga sp. HaHa_2_95]
MNYKKLVFVLLFLLLLPNLADAQCAMCRAVLESEEGMTTAKGINDGIVYLMAIPYILVGVLFYFVYRKMKSSKS